MKDKISQTFEGLTIEDVSLSEKAASLIRKKIIRGVLEPGQRLTENELANALDISRACVREALQTLEYEGLVKKRVNKYTEVVTLSLQDVEEIYRLRAAIECCCVETSIIKHSLPIKQLEQEAKMINQRHKDTVSMEENNTWIDEDFAFHEMIILSSQNKRAIQAWLKLKSQATLILYNTVFHNYNQGIVGDHMDLVNVLKEGSIPIAVAKIKEHIMIGFEYLEKYMGENT